jgi:hypothetical protein
LNTHTHTHTTESLELKKITINPIDELPARERKYPELIRDRTIENINVKKMERRKLSLIHQ